MYSPFFSQVKEREEASALEAALQAGRAELEAKVASVEKQERVAQVSDAKQRLRDKGSRQGDRGQVYHASASGLCLRHPH